MDGCLVQKRILPLRHDRERFFSVPTPIDPFYKSDSANSELILSSSVKVRADYGSGKHVQ